jgi:hypothetical protein
MMCAPMWGEDSHDMGVSFLSHQTMCTPVLGEYAHVMGVRQTLE